MLRDAEYFKTRIGGLDGAGDSGDYLVNMVKEKSVPVRAVVTKPVKTAPSVTNGKTSTEIVTESKGEVKGDEKNSNSVEEQAAT